MKDPFYYKSIVLVIFSSLVFASCDKPESANQDSSLGEVHFDYSGTKESMAAFERGLLLLHNFEYKDARAAFLEAQSIDSNMVMAYWGEAMSYNHTLWEEQDFEEGKAALQKLGDSHEIRSERTSNQLEKDFLYAAHLLYQAGDKNERDKAYSDYLKKMYSDYPDNNEVATFYALSIMGAVPVDRDPTAYEKSAAVVANVLDRNPRHPGALHYMIHANDDPAHAHLALDAANAYSKVAADAVHALHMPSHIFLSVGMWDEVVSSNIDSWEASVQRKNKKELDNDALSYHAFHWLLYGYLQQGQFEEAASILDDMKRYTSENPSRMARSYLVSMQGAYLIESEDWKSALVEPNVDLSELSVSALARQLLTRGFRAYHFGEPDTLAALIDTLNRAIVNGRLMVNDQGMPMCSSGGNSSYNITSRDLNDAAVMLMELKALHALLNDNSQLAEVHLQDACNQESDLAFGFGPPGILKPSHEMYADFLLELGRFPEAVLYYQKALERAPNRRLCNIGLVKCQEVEKEVDI